MDIEASNLDTEIHKLTLSRLKDFEDTIEIPTEFLAEFELGQVLGSGEFSVVRQCTDKKTGESYAVKIVDRSRISEAKQRSEIQILMSVQHENIIALKKVFESKRHIFIVTELVTGGQLFDELVTRGIFSEIDAANIILQIVNGVDYLHDQHIVHRDIKPENILFAKPGSNVIKIADFGLSKILGNASVMITPCGTPVCVAPEILCCTGYGKEVDCWAIGVLMFILLSGCPPFQDGLEDDNLSLLYEQIIRGEFQFYPEQWCQISDLAKDLVCKLLQVEPSKRITTKQILQHPWILHMTGRATSESKELNSINEMKKFNVRRRFRTAIYSLLGMRPYLNPTPQQIKWWKASFVKMSKDGKVTGETLKALLKEIGLDVSVDPRISDITRQTKEPTIDFDTFMYYVKTLPRKPTQAEVKKAFWVLDKNEDGLVSYDNLRDVFKGVLLKGQEEDVLKFVETTDTRKLDYSMFYRKLLSSEETLLRRSSTTLNESSN